MTDGHRIPPFAVAEARDLLVEIFEELDWGFEHGDYHAEDRRKYAKSIPRTKRPKKNNKAARRRRHRRPDLWHKESETNAYVLPKPSEIRSAWDEIQPFMEKLWP